MKKTFVKLIVLLLCILITLNIPSTPTHTYPEKNQYTPLLTSLSLTYPRGEGTLRVMTYNLLADTPGFEGAPAYSRAEGVCGILNTLSPDVAALQEVSRNWFYSLNQSTPYKFVSPAKTNFLGTMTALLYNPEAVTLLQWGSHTFSRTLNGRLRCAVWGVFSKADTGKKFTVISTHLSLSDRENQFPEQQARELLELSRELEARYGCPVIFTGDFNSDKRTAENTVAGAYEILGTALTDTLRVTNEKASGNAKGFSSYRTDHIFINKALPVRRYVILSQRQFSDLSDHYPVFVDFLL